MLLLSAFFGCFIPLMTEPDLVTMEFCNVFPKPIENCLRSVLLRNAMVAARDGLYNKNRLEGGRVYLRGVGSSHDGVLSRGREYPDSPVRPW